MPRDLSGNYTLPAGNPVVAATTITPAWGNGTMSDIALQLNNVVTRDGLLNPLSPVQFPAGTAAAPGITFAGSLGMGFYRAGADILGFATAGVTRGNIAANGLWSMFADVGGEALTISNAIASTACIVTLANTSDTAGSAAQIIIGTGGVSAGDSSILFRVTGITNVIVGIDNSDSDKWKISAGSVLGTTDILTIDPTTRGITIAAPASGPTLALSAAANLALVVSNSAAGGLSTGDRFALSTHNTNGRLTSDAGAELVALSTWYDATVLELSAGSSGASKNGIVIRGGGATTLPNTVSLWTKDTKYVEVSAAGNFTIAAPASGVGFTQTGFAGSDTTVLNGGTSGSFRVTDRGLPYGTSIHNNAGSVTGTTNQYIASGTYTPTLTNTTNISASTARKSTWTRLGNVVRVSGNVQITVTTGSSNTELGISLPIASNLAAAAFNDLNGSMTRFAPVGTAPQTCACIADNTNDRSKSSWLHDANTGSEDWAFSFEYEIL